MKIKLEELSDAKIIYCNFEEWASYLANKYYITPISIFEANIEKTLSETKLKRINPFRGYAFEKDYFEIDGVQITFQIPFDGNSDLFELKPSSYILSSFSTQSFIDPCNETCTSLLLIPNVRNTYKRWMW